MPNEWIEKLKRFNADGGVWAIPKRNTEERKMLDRGQRFKYSLLKERFPDLARQLEEEVTNREAKAKMRKAEELIKQAEAIEKVVTRRKLRILPKEEEKPKQQAKPAEKKKQEPIKKVGFYGDLEIFMSGNRNEFKKLQKDKPDVFKTIENLGISPKSQDFYPTPDEALEPDLKYLIKRHQYILEPTAGLGNIVDYIIRNSDKDTQIDANELNPKFAKFLEEKFPGVEVTNRDFLTEEFDPSYNLIVCNPPFSLGTDKKAYYDFLFKCLYLLNTNNRSREATLYFICLQLTQRRLEEDSLFEFRDILDKVSYEKAKENYEKLRDEKLDKKEYKEREGDTFEDFEDYLGAYQCKFIKEVSGFGGTNVKASVYEFITIR